KRGHKVINQNYIEVSLAAAMSILLLSGRKKAITEKKKVVRKVGKLADGQDPVVTASWKVTSGGKKTAISFSRDNMNVYVDGNPVECTAYVTDKGYDLDLLFNLGENKGHIYSDVEGTDMTNYLFFDDQLIAQEKQSNLKSNHVPGELP
ncbi:fas apoptotic inhibitory molecule 1, partial [Biomphalaria glabrata]